MRIAGKDIILSSGGTNPYGWGQMNDSVLREKAREAINKGNLPTRNPDRIVGGPGCGEACALCGETVRRNRMELEPEFRQDGEAPEPHKHHLHPRCFMAWEFERTQG